MGGVGLVRGSSRGWWRGATPCRGEWEGGVGEREGLVERRKSMQG